MSGERPHRRKVISGSPVYFEEDVSLREEALADPLPLPGLLSFEELVVLFRDQFFHLVEGDGVDHMNLCGLSFALVPFATVRILEEQYLTVHADAVARCRVDFLRALHPALLDDAGALVRTNPTRQAATLALEKLRRLVAANPVLPPKTPTPIDHVRLPADPSKLIAVRPDWERTLFLDGRSFDLLTTREYFEAWQRGFHPDVVEQVRQRPTPWPAKELAELLMQNAGRANARALSVVRSGLQAPHRPVQINLDGLDFVPVHRGRAAGFTEDWLRVLADDVKRRALEELLAEN